MVSASTRTRANKQQIDRYCTHPRTNPAILLTVERVDGRLQWRVRANPSAIILIVLMLIFIVAIINNKKSRLQLSSRRAKNDRRTRQHPSHCPYLCIYTRELTTAGAAAGAVAVGAPKTKNLWGLAAAGRSSDR